MRLRRARTERRGPDPASLLPAPTAPTDAAQAPLSPVSGNEQSPPPQRSPQRPDNVIGLVSDIISDRSKGYNFLIVVAGVLIISTACFAGGVLAIAEAFKGLKGVPLPAVLAGVPGASILAYLANRLRRWIVKTKRWFTKPTNGDRDGLSGG
jgi:hypothetical protein